MTEDREPALVTFLLFPFRLILFLGELAALLWVLLIVGGILALIGAFLWLLLTGSPR